MASTRSLPDILSDTTDDEAIRDKDGAQVPVDLLTGKDTVVALYFSGKWCMPCRTFTSMLVDWYHRLRPPHHHVIYVNSDENEIGYKLYYGSMPWYTAGYDTNIRRELRERYNPVGRVPRLVMVDGHTGEIITDDGRRRVMDDLDDAALPWKKL